MFYRRMSLWIIFPLLGFVLCGYSLCSYNTNTLLQNITYILSIGVLVFALFLGKEGFFPKISPEKIANITKNAQSKYVIRLPFLRAGICFGRAKK